MSTLPPPPSAPPPPPLPPAGAAPSPAATFPPPTGAQVLRALRAPVIGYAWLVAGALGLMVLVVIAANTGSAGADTGVEADDTNALGVLVGMPFQIAGMALLGSLQFSEDGVRASLYAPPLLLTVLYAVMTARAARRGDAVPAAGTRTLLAVAVGLPAAVAVTVLTRVLAMRSDGVAFHAATVSLFFGTWALTAVATYVGTSLTVGDLRPAWVPRDYAAAARVWVGSVLVWLLASTVALTGVAVVREGFWLGLLFPVWGPTAGLYTYAIAHLGSVGVAGESAHLGDVGAGWAVLLVVAALLLAAATSTAWHLRRDTSEATLARPGSWAVLPVVFTAGGALVWLVPSVVAGGGYGELGGSVTLQPAFWLVFVLLVWGAAVEVASRFAAPRFAAVLPERLRTILRGPVRTAERTPPPAAAATRPLTPEERRRYRRMGVLVGVVAGLGLVGWVVVAVVNSQLYRPEDQAARYLDAVVRGDLQEAADLAPTDDDLADDALLRDEVYRAADTRITGYELGEVEEDGDTVTVEVELEGLDGSQDAELTLQRNGSTHVLFDRWKVTDGGLAEAVTFYVPDGAGDLTVNGVEVEALPDSAWLLPGSYAIDAFAGNRWLESEGEPVTVLAGEDYQYAEVPGASGSEEFRDEVQRQVDDYLADCLAATDLEPEGCPNAVYEGTEVRNVQWTLFEAPTPDFEYFDGSFPADLGYGESGTASVTYEADESYGFGAPDWQQRTEEAELYLSSVTVREEGDDLVVDIEG